MASPAGTSGGELSIQMPAAARGSAAPEPEKVLNRLVWFLALGEWAGNAFGALAFLWGTVVVLGGFCSSLNRGDFWFAAALIFIEAFRIFNSKYTLDNQSLFGTTRALRWISSHFSSMLVQPQEGNEVVLITGLCLNLINQLTIIIKFSIRRKFPEKPMRMDFNPELLSSETLEGILAVVLLIILCKVHLRGALHLTSRLRRRRHLYLWVLLISYLSIGAYIIISPGYKHLVYRIITLPHGLYVFIYLQVTSFSPLLASILTSVVAVLLLNSRPRRITNLTSSPCGRKLLSLAKVISAVWLACRLVMPMVSDTISEGVLVIGIYGTSFTGMVLSLGSLQNLANNLFGRWIDFIMHILFLLNLVFPLSPPVVHFWGIELTKASFDAMALIILLAALLISNLQIPAAVSEVVLSSLRLSNLHYDYNQQPKGSSPNMVPSIAVFYVLALCQGSLYIMACILWLFSFFPIQWLANQSGFSGRWGARAVNLYYQCAYTEHMEIGVFSSGKTLNLVTFAMESLTSSSPEMQLAGVRVLDSFLEQKESNEDLISVITSSKEAVSTLISMLDWTPRQDRSIRLFAARVTTKIAGNLSIAKVPGIVKSVSSLLDVKNQPPMQELLDSARRQQSLTQGQTSSVSGGNAGNQGADAQSVDGEGNNGWHHMICCYWRRIKERWSWSTLEELTLTHQDSLPVLGMVILEKLARDLDNCAEIFKATNVISKTIGLISYANHRETINIVQQNALIYSSLDFVRRLAITGERIGIALRKELWNHPLLLNNLAGVMEDARSSPQLWEPTTDVIAKLSLDKEAGLEIGRIQVITGRLLHAFLERDGLTNMHYDQSLRKVSGEALANLTLWGTANCLAILEEPGYQVIKDLKDMLSDDVHRCVAACLLSNLCAHCSVKLSHLDASENLSSALTIVMEHIMTAEGKQLESLISLASEIGDLIREEFVGELESQTNSGAELVQKLICTLNSNKIPNPEYPRMRRVIVKMLISILESCHRTVEKMVEQGVMEGLMDALSKIERTPSKVEKYRVFYGNIGVVLESGSSVSEQVARTKGLIDSAAATPGGQLGDHA